MRCIILDKETALMELKRIFISPTISSEKMVKVKAVYNEILNAPSVTVDMKQKVNRIKSGKF